MQVRSTEITGVLIFVPTPHKDERGFFTRTFDAEIAGENGLDATAFVQDSQSRSRQGVLRGLHGRSGAGEGKLVRCARGAIYDVVVDARPSSPTFSQVAAFRLDDEQFWHLFIPPGLLHGFQVLTEEADICYRIDRPHDHTEDVSVRYDDPDLSIEWPLPVASLSVRDSAAGSWHELRKSLH